MAVNQPFSFMSDTVGHDHDQVQRSLQPLQLSWLEKMTSNAEARENVWLGEVSALEESLTHLL